VTAIRAADLESYLDEALPTEEMTRIEAALRADSQLATKLAEIIARRDGGLISLGAVWRRHRLSCPTRQELGSYLLGLLPEDTSRYLEFHLDVAGCRYCQANLADLKEHQAESHEAVNQRRQKYFQSSAGRLRKGG
jgi:anti-sigma factor RsiW